MSLALPQYFLAILFLTKLRSHSNKTQLHNTEFKCVALNKYNMQLK